MQAYIGLLRAVNVGGTGKLPMAELKAVCEAAGFAAVRTYIASGNVVFKSGESPSAVKAALEARLAAYAGKQIRVVVRTIAEMAEVLQKNPFADAPGNRVLAIFFDQPVTNAALDGVTGQAGDEKLFLGKRELYVLYGSGIGASKLRIPAAKAGTARNMNTVARLAAMALE
jgi:uncharacterized protein (DUF1697 family)